MLLFVKVSGEMEVERGGGGKEAGERGEVGMEEGRTGSVNQGMDTVDLTGSEGTKKGGEMREGGVSSSSSSSKQNTLSRASASSGLLQSFSRKKSRKREVNLTSVLNLQQVVRNNQHKGTTISFVHV